MFKISKTLIASAALIAVGFVTVADMAQSRTESAASVVETRFPSASEAWAVVSLPGVEAPKAAKPTSASCSREHWPYVSDECLSNKEKIKRPARKIVIERVATAQTQVRS